MKLYALLRAGVLIFRFTGTLMIASHAQQTINKNKTVHSKFYQYPPTWHVVIENYHSLSGGPYSCHPFC